MIITEEQIDKAEELGACEESLEWLRKKPRTWFQLAERDYEWLSWDSYKTKLCPSEVLEQLSKHPDPEIRVSVARHCNSSHETFTVLSKDEDPCVRGEVAGNKHTPLNILQILSKDSNEYVKKMLALNPFISTKIISYLVDNGGIKTRVFITYQKNLPEEIIIKLAKDISETVRKNLIAFHILPYNVAISLANDPDFNVRYWLACRSGFEEVLKILSNDDNVNVRERAILSHKQLFSNK